MLCGHAAQGCKGRDAPRESGKEPPLSSALPVCLSAPAEPQPSTLKAALDRGGFSIRTALVGCTEPAHAALFGLLVLLGSAAWQDAVFPVLASRSVLRGNRKLVLQTGSFTKIWCLHIPCPNSFSCLMFVRHYVPPVRMHLSTFLSNKLSVSKASKH